MAAFLTFKIKPIFNFEVKNGVSIKLHFFIYGKKESPAEKQWG